METTIKFYQTDTFTVGNRLLSEAERSVQAGMQRTNALNSGHRACQGCGEALGARFAVDAAMRAAGNDLIACNATGCQPCARLGSRLSTHSNAGASARLSSGRASKDSRKWLLVRSTRGSASLKIDSKRS